MIQFTIQSDRNGDFSSALLLNGNQLFPYQIWHSIYSANLIESLNKEIKCQTKKKVLFPNEVDLARY